MQYSFILQFKLVIKVSQYTAKHEKHVEIRQQIQITAT